MARRFIYLRNTGSPTSWDVTRYMAYLERASDTFPDHLRSLVARERFQLPSQSPMSLWHSDIAHVEFDDANLIITGMSGDAMRRFLLTYRGVRRVEVCLRSYYLPSIVVQELVVLRNGLLRHAYSDLGGDVTTIVAEEMAFEEHSVQ